MGLRQCHLKDDSGEVDRTQLSQSNSLTNLCTWDDLPSWQRNNYHIRTSYRCTSNSTGVCLLSLFYLHNESVNIHSHIFGALLFASLSYILYVQRDQRVFKVDNLAFASFFIGAIFCLSVSAIYHSMSNHSPKVSRIWHLLDHVGVLAMILGSFLPSIYYGFCCDPLLQRGYWVMILAIGIACTTMTVTPQFRTPDWRAYRAAMFVAMGLSAVFPVVHGARLYSRSRTNDQIGLRWLLLEGFLYVTGATLYAVRIPEGLKPGAFDLWGSSHQIFHILIVLAAAAHLLGLLRAFEYSKITVCAGLAS